MLQIYFKMRFSCLYFSVFFTSLSLCASGCLNIIAIRFLVYRELVLGSLDIGLQVKYTQAGYSQ